LIQNCAFQNSNNRSDLLCFNQSKCICSGCHFDSIHCYAILIDNNSQLSLERSSFDKSDCGSIFIRNDSVGEVFDVKIRNCQNAVIFIYNHSKLNISDSFIENCRNGIASQSNSEVKASNCHFNKMAEYPLCCYSSSIINLDASEMENPGKAFIYLKEGIIKMNLSIMKQSNKEIPLSVIESSGKITLMAVKIDWDGSFDRRSTFTNADFIQLTNVSLNGKRIADFLFEKE
jgi:hypothetical protein